MKTHTLLALAVMAATGCETYPPMKPVSPEVLAEYRAWKAKQPKIKFQPGTDMLGIPPTPVVWGGSQQQAQPVVVTSGNYPVTTVAPNAMGGSTIVNYGLPVYRPPVAPHPFYGY